MEVRLRATASLLRKAQRVFWRLWTAADAVCLPKAKPRAIGVPRIVPPIGSREVACCQRSGVRQGEHALQQFDLGNGPLRIHLLSIIHDERRHVNGTVSDCRH